MLAEREARKRAEYERCVNGLRIEYERTTYKWCVYDEQNRKHAEFSGLNDAKRECQKLRKRMCGHLRTQS